MNRSPYHFSDFRSEEFIKLASNNCPRNAACDGCSAQHISLCSVLDRGELEAFSQISTDHHINARQIICSEDEKAEYLYNIRGGAVRISKMLSDGRRQITGFLFAGDFFGLSCQDRYNYTAEAITNVDICRFPRVKIIQSFRTFPELGDRAFEMTRTELNSTHDQMLLLGRKTAREKLCSFLLTMREKSILPETYDEAPDKKEVDIPMSRSDIADYLGLTVETISRQFTKLHKLGLIEMDGAHKVFLKDIKALSSLATPD